MADEGSLFFLRLPLAVAQIAIPTGEFLGDEFHFGKGGSPLLLPLVIDVEQLPPLTEQVSALVVEHVGEVAEIRRHALAGVRLEGRRSRWRRDNRRG